MSQSPPSVAPALIRKLDEKLARFTMLREQMNDPAVLANPQKLIAADANTSFFFRLRFTTGHDRTKLVDRLGRE